MPIPTTCRATHRFVLSSLLLLTVGCGGVQTGRIELDPQAAAKEALRLYDADNDGALDKAELEKSPALRSAVSRIDSDGNGQLTAQEIATRTETYKNLSTHIAGEVRVTRQRRPLAEAKVTLEPEPFLGSGYPTYHGTTDQNGVVTLTSSPPTPGIAVGFYRVTITLPDGTETIQGCEVADDVPAATRMEFSL